MMRPLALIAFACAAVAQPPEFENSYVRVRRVSLDPNATSESQWQPQRALVALTPARLRLTIGESAPVTRKLSAGDALWLPAGEARIDSLDAAPFDAWMVEFKGDAAKAAARSRAPDPSESVLIENSRARILRVRLAPGAKSGMHKHPGRIGLPLGAQKYRTTFDDGVIEDSERQSGQVFWAGPNGHATENTADSALETILIETKATPLSADLQGIKLHYTDDGAGARAIILIHGWTADSTTWKLQIPGLSTRYRVLTIDLPGHGKSEAPEAIRYTPSLFADAVAAVCRAAAVKRVVVAGHSMGVTVARETWRKHRHLVEGFIGVDGFFIQPANIEPFNAWAKQWDTPTFRKRQADFVRPMFTPSAPKPMIAAVLKMVAATPKHVAVSAIANMADPKVHNLDVIDVPGLLIFSSSGLSTAPAAVEFHRARFQKVEIDVWPNGGHFPMLEQPERLNRKVIEFLSGLPSAQ